MRAIDTNTPSAYAIELAWGGKLPSMGDFVWSDGQTSSLRVELDNWLLAGMQQFRLAANDWKSSFDQAPIWNFIVPAGALGPGCVVGCISPSCDRVGRRYPFTVAYGISAQAPTSYLTKVIDASPPLLSETGTLVFNGIQRQWPREVLGTLIKQMLTSWQESSLQPLEPDSSSSEPDQDSDILNVLTGKDDKAHGTLTNNVNRHFSSLPWRDVVTSLTTDSTTGFWWINGAGGAAPKTFTYGTHLDGELMTWLFGSAST